ncbi:MAG: CDP-archaeol synthase [Treponema sp.]|nr:CDP-archaeol synthase [Treponema sp.]
MNSKTIKRLLIFFIGLPVVILICLLPYQNNLLFNIAVVISSAIAAYEMHNMLSTQAVLFPKWAVIAASALNPLLNYICIRFKLDLNYTIWLLILEIIIFMGVESFTAKTFENSAKKIGFTSLILFYCGYMLAFIGKLSAIESNPSYFIALFILLVYMCDSIAWFFGITMGKSTRGKIACSPNKSIVGFIGGVAGSIVSGLIAWFFFKNIFTGSPLKMLLLSVLTALAAITGDLVESVIKRSCNFKDSGGIIPGRGGILDSIDSLIVAAPVYYITCYFLYLI